MKVTLGLKGRHVVIEKSFDARRITKDSVTVAKETEVVDKFENALNTTRAAVEEVIVNGGGTALLRAKKTVKGITREKSDVKAGIVIVLKALEAPHTSDRVEYRHRGLDRGRQDHIEGPRHLRLNAQTEEHVDMIQTGIVEPAKVQL